jgi:RNA polymerase sigma-70 factor (ECF subfamily)
MTFARLLHAEPASPASTDGAAAVEPPDFATLYQSHFDFVWRSLRRLGVPESALDDAHQEVFLVAHRRLDQFQGRSTLKTWLFGILLNVVRRHRRTRRRDAAHDPLPDTLVDANQAGPMEAALKLEAARMLQSFLDGLDPDKRAVFVLAELEQMTAQEVAEATETNLRTVYSRLRVARQLFEQAVTRFRARDGWRDHARAQ